MRIPFAIRFSATLWVFACLTAVAAAPDPQRLEARLLAEKVPDGATLKCPAP